MKHFNGATLGRRLDLVLLVALAAWAAAPVVYLVREASASGRAFTGAAGIFPGDQLQYLSWIRSAGEHGLAANGFDLDSGGHVFLHPMFVLSGLLWRAGGSLELSLLLWTPVAVGVLFLGYRRFCARFFADPLPRAAALALALFSISPLVALIGWDHLPGAEAVRTVGGDTTTAPLLWGYLPSALALGLMPLFLLGLERLMSKQVGRGSAWLLAGTAGAGALTSWLHPWQGETLLLVTAGLAVSVRPRRAHLGIGVAALATALPLLYYFALGRADGAWAVAQAQTPLERPSLLGLILTLGPVALFAVAGIRPTVREPRDRVLLLWPVAALAVTFAFSAALPSHALQGIALPIATLAVRGWQALRAPAVLAPLGLALATLPGAAFFADSERAAIDESRPGFFLGPGDLEALRHLEGLPGPGGVLTSPGLAPAVPAYTGRRTWVGHPVWTPRYPQRAREATDLFSGRLTGRRAQGLLRRASARWVLAPCGAAPNLRVALGSRLRRVRRFGCATLYEVATESRAALVRSPRTRPPRSSRTATAADPTATAAHRPSISTE